MALAVENIVWVCVSNHTLLMVKVNVLEYFLEELCVKIVCVYTYIGYPQA